MHNMVRYIGLLCALFFGAVLTQDPCRLLVVGNQYWFGPTADLIDCFTSIPYNSARNTATVAQLRYMADLYGFTDLVNQTLPPWNINVDLNSGIDAILTASYSNDYSFHVAVANLLNGLQDAHTRYAMPYPYRNAFILRPFGLRITNENGNMKFMTTTPAIGSSSEFLSAVAFNPSLYYNQEVTSIDGQSPLTWLKSYANNYCRGYKDEKVRFNAAVSPLGCFAAYDGSLYSIENLPASHTMIIGGQTLTVPNLAILLEGLLSTQQATTLLTTPQTSKRSIEELNSLAMPDIHRERKERLQPLVNKETKNHREIPQVDYSALNTKKSMTLDVKRSVLSDPQVLQVTTSSLNNFDFSLTTSDLTTWRGLLTTASGNNIPVLRVQSFYPTSSDEFVVVVDDFTEQLARNKFDAAIIDVSENGGGFICLANYLLAALVEDFTDSNVYGKYDLRKTAANDELVQGQFISGPDYLKLGTTTSYSAFDTTWYDERQSSRALSQLVHYPSECQDIFAVAYPPRKFFAKNIVVVTDGTCGSACALFVAKMEQSGKAKIVTHGGTTESPSMTSNSFAGGNVLDWPSLVSAANSNGVSTPTYLPTSALISFTHHEMYLSDEDTPLEFLFSPAQFHIYYWDAITNGDVNTDAGALTRVNLYETASQAFGAIVQKSSANHVAISAIWPILALLIVLLCKSI